MSGGVSVTDLFAKLSDTDQAVSQETDSLATEPDDVENTAQAEPANIEEHSDPAQPSKRIRMDLPEPEVTKPNYFWTWRLLADGYSPSHLRQVRQLDEETIFSHAIVAIENELPAQHNWLLDEEKIQAIESFVGDNPSQRTSELLSKIPKRLKPVSYTHLTLPTICSV